jgi:hypothetical protein
VAVRLLFPAGSTQVPTLPKVVGVGKSLFKMSRWLLFFINKIKGWTSA